MAGRSRLSSGSPTPCSTARRSSGSCSTSPVNSSSESWRALFLRRERQRAGGALAVAAIGDFEVRLDRRWQRLREPRPAGPARLDWRRRWSRTHSSCALGTVKQKTAPPAAPARPRCGRRGPAPARGRWPGRGRRRPGRSGRPLAAVTRSARRGRSARRRAPAPRRGCRGRCRRRATRRSARRRRRRRSTSPPGGVCRRALSTRLRRTRCRRARSAATGGSVGRDAAPRATPWSGRGPRRRRGSRTPGRAGRCAQTQLERAALDLAQLEQVVDQAAEVLHLAPDQAEVALHLGRLGDDAVGEGLDHGAGGGQRGAQVVRDGGDQLAAGRLERASRARSWSSSCCGHVVEGLRQARDLVVPGRLDARAEVAAARGGAACCRQASSWRSAAGHGERRR